MVLDITGPYPVVNGHRIRYVTIMRPGWYGCNDSAYDWDGWNKEKDRPAILELLTEAAQSNYAKIGRRGGSFARLRSGDKEIVHFGFHERANHARHPA